MSSAILSVGCLSAWVELVGIITESHLFNVLWRLFGRSSARVRILLTIPEVKGGMQDQRGGRRTGRGVASLGGSAGEGRRRGHHEVRVPRGARAAITPLAIKYSTARVVTPGRHRRPLLRIETEPGLRRPLARFSWRPCRAVVRIHGGPARFTGVSPMCVDRCGALHASVVQ